MALIRLADMPPEIKPLERLILTVVMQRAPCGYSDLMEGTGLSRRSINDHCRRLEERGYIEREYRLTGAQGNDTCLIRPADPTQRQPPAAAPPNPPPDCVIGKCRPRAAAVFKAYHANGGVYHICAACGELLGIPLDKRHKLDDGGD